METSGALRLADTLERLAAEQEAAQGSLLCVRSHADWLVGFLSVPGPMSKPSREYAHRKAQELLAEITAAQAASSEPEVQSVGTMPDAGHETHGSGSLGAEAENWCYYTWPANAGSSKGRTAAFEAVNLGSSPSPAVSLGAEADAALIRNVLEDERLHPGTSPTVFGYPGCDACEALAALDRLLAGKAAV